MTNQAELSNALESDFRAIASRTRATELKKLWQGAWQAIGVSSRASNRATSEQGNVGHSTFTEGHSGQRVVQQGSGEPAGVAETQTGTAAVNNESLQRAA